MLSSNPKTCPLYLVVLILTIFLCPFLMKKVPFPKLAIKTLQKHPQHLALRQMLNAAALLLLQLTDGAVSPKSLLISCAKNEPSRHFFSRWLSPGRLSSRVKTRERRGSSFSQLGLEPNHTGLTAQSLFFLEESCRVKRSDTQTFSNFSNYFKRVLKLQKRSSSFSK